MSYVKRHSTAMHPTALICASVLGILVFGLGFAISGLRFSENRLFAYSDDPRSLLHKVVRAHGNATEYAPFLAILFLFLGSRSPSQVVLWLMVGATVARVVHAIGLIAWPSIAKPNPLRFVGAIGTYTCGLGLCVYLFWSF